MTQDGIEPAAYADLQQDIAEVVAATRVAASRSVNAVTTASYWAIGRRIVEFEQGGAERATYGEALIRRFGADLARGHWVKPGENPPVGLILCAEKGAAEVHYALDNLPNKILAAEYQTVLPDETLIAQQLERTRVEFEQRCESSGSGAAKAEECAGAAPLRACANQVSDLVDSYQNRRVTRNSSVSCSSSPSARQRGSVAI